MGGWGVGGREGALEGGFCLVPGGAGLRVGVVWVRAEVVGGDFWVVEVAHVREVEVRVEVDRGRDRGREGVLHGAFARARRVRVLLVLRRLLALRRLFLPVRLSQLRRGLCLRLF